MKNSALLLAFCIIFNNSNLYGQLDSSSAKTTACCPAPPFVLIPSGVDTRVGWLNSGGSLGCPYGFVGIMAPSYSVVSSYNSTTFTQQNRILNPAGYGGLPVHFTGFSAYSLSGIDRYVSTAPGVNIVLCATMIGSSLNHYILYANEPPTATDYTVTSIVTLSGPLPASGWQMSDISVSAYDCISGTFTSTLNLYAMFSNGSTTYVAEISSGGIITPLHSWPTCFNSFNGAGGSAFVLSNFSAGYIETYDYLTGTSTTIPIPVSPGCGGLLEGQTFVTQDIFIPYPNKLYYNGSDIYSSSSTSPLATTYYTVQNMTPVIYSSMVGFGFDMCGISAY